MPTRTRHSSCVRSSHFSLVVIGLTACSSQQVPLPRTSDIHILGKIAVFNRPRNVLYRDEINDAQTAGLAYFLQKVDLQAQCETNEQTLRVCSRNDPEQKRFVGFKIVAMRPATAWLPFDFSPGDIVTQVNGVSVEHYDAAISLFDSLAQANSLEVSVLRGAELIVIKVRIESKDGGAPRL